MPHVKWMYASTVIVLLVLGIFSDGVFDISSHDTYYVVQTRIVIFIIALIYLLFWAFEWLIEKFKRKISKTLSWIHFSITTACILGLTILSNINLLPDDDTFDILASYEKQAMINNWILVLFAAIILSQIILIVNLIRSVSLKK